MTPTPAPLEARTQNASRVRIFMFLRPRRILAALSVMLVALAGTAMALPLGGLPAVPAVPGVPALPQTPDLPAIDQSIDTPVGGASVHAADGQVDVCANAAADTGMLPQAPAIPALPVQAPVALPEIPDAKAGAAAKACAHANAYDLSASADADASGYAMDKQFGLKTGAKASKAGIGADLETSGVATVVLHAFQALL